MLDVWCGIKLYIDNIFSVFFHMASLQDSFYLTLTSHDPNKAFAETNTPFKFTVVLPGKMRLDIEQWEVGLAEMFIPDYGFNTKHPCEESLKITYERVIEDEGGIGLAKVNPVDYISIKEGRYSAKEWVNRINDRIRVMMWDKIVKNNLFMGCLCYNEVGNHIEVMLGIQEGMTMTDPMLAHMTGWERVGYEIFNGGNRKMRSTLPYHCQFEANSKQMMVYTDIIAFSTVGSENMPFLHTIHLEPDGLPCHRQFNEIQYHCLWLEETDHVEIHLTNTFGKPIDFRDGTHSTAVLHFRCHHCHGKEAETMETDSECSGIKCGKENKKLKCEYYERLINVYVMPARFVGGHLLLKHTEETTSSEAVLLTKWRQQYMGY